jgi:hypothetical protein
MKKLQFKGDSKTTKKTVKRIREKEVEVIVEGWAMALKTQDINGPCLMISISNNNTQILNRYIIILTIA